MKMCHLFLHCSRGKDYGTAQFKIDIYTRVTLELFNKFVKLLVSYMRVHDKIL